MLRFAQHDSSKVRQATLLKPWFLLHAVVWIVCIQRLQKSRCREKLPDGFCVYTLDLANLLAGCQMVESDSGEVVLVKLILRNKEYEVKPGMTLLSALQKIDVVPESVIATREGEMILDDEILKDGDMVKLIAVISGG